MYFNSPRFKNLDDLEFIEYYTLRADTKKQNQKAVAEKNFDNSFTQIVLNRIIQNDCDNPYSKSLVKLTTDLKNFNKQLFLNMYHQAMQKKPSNRINLLWDLCYLKHEQISFVKAFVDSLEKLTPEQARMFRDDNLSQYLLEIIQDRSQIYGKTVQNHLASTQKFRFKETIKTFRSARKNNWEFGTIYVSDSTADSLVFDKSINLFDAILTLPGLKLRDLQFKYLSSIIELCYKVFKIEDYRAVKIILNVGFVDKLRVASSRSLIDPTLFETQMTKILDKVLSNVSALSNNRISIELQNNSFPTCTIEKTKINGLVSYFPGNIEATKIIDRVLATQINFNRVKYQCFKPSSEIKKQDLVHEREIHPRLGIQVKNI